MRRALQIFVALVGTVALIAGLETMLFGAEHILGSGDFTAPVDSEMRFYAVWYAAAGVILLRSVPRVESSGLAIRGFAAALFLAGCTRVLSIAVVGRPHSLHVLLMILELVIPVVLVPWQAAVSRKRPVVSEE